MINPRAIAVQGIGFAPAAIATQGFYGAGLFIILGGFGQVVGFGIPTIGVGAGALEIQIPSLGEIMGFGTPIIGGGATTNTGLFIRITKSIWDYITRGIWN